MTRAVVAALAARGIEAVYGDPIPGIATIEVPAHLALLLADAHAAVRLRPAAVSAGGTVRVGEVLLGGEPGPPAATWCEPDCTDVAAIREAGSPVVVSGRGVHMAGALSGLHALAAALSCGVLNTVAAKGTFDWRSRHHWATVGLQRDDLALAGAHDADLVVATGLEPADERLLDDLPCPVVAVAPEALAPMAELVARPFRALEYPPLRALLGAISQEGWDFTGAPLAPSRVTRNYAEVLGPRALVSADAGVPGFWVGRTYTTMAPAVAVVASTRAPGFAFAAALVSRLHDPFRPTLAVTGPTAAPIDLDLLELAASIGASFAVERWSGDGEPLDASQHADRVRRLVAIGEEATVAPDDEQLGRMEAVAGPVTAWEDER